MASSPSSESSDDASSPGSQAADERQPGRCSQQEGAARDGRADHPGIMPWSGAGAGSNGSGNLPVALAGAAGPSSLGSDPVLGALLAQLEACPAAGSAIVVDWTFQHGSEESIGLAASERQANGMTEAAHADLAAMMPQHPTPSMPLNVSTEQHRAVHLTATTRFVAESRDRRLIITIFSSSSSCFSSCKLFVDTHAGGCRPCPSRLTMLSFFGGGEGLGQSRTVTTATTTTAGGYNSPVGRQCWRSQDGGECLHPCCSAHN